MNEPVQAVPQDDVLDCLDRDPSIPTDDIALLTVLLPVVTALAIFVSAIAGAIIEDPRSLLRDGLGLGRSEEHVKRLTKADRQANERHKRHVERACLDLLEVLPVDVAPLRSFFERPVSRVSQRSESSSERTLLLLESCGTSVGLRGPFGLG